MDVALFSRSPLLARIDRDELGALVARAERRNLRTGRMLFQRGDPGDGVFAIVSGRVKVYLEADDGGEVIVAMRTTGDVLGELSLLDGHRRSASAIALDPVTILRISTDHFQTWLGEHPRAAQAMLRELAQRLRDTTDQVAEIALFGIDTRIARRLWQLFSEAARDGKPAEGMTLRVNQSAMASVVGVTRESVNKHLAKMKQDGVLSIEAGKVTILDLEPLREMAREI